MARFPIPEGDIKTLAQNIVAGLTAHAAVYTAPPVTPAALQAVLDSFITLSTEATEARAAAKAAGTTKDAGLLELTDAMKAVLRYAEDKVAYDNDKLAWLGWSGRSAATPTILEIPGQTRALEAPRQGEGWVFLDWKEPAEGGQVASYRIERRERPAGAWSVAGMAVDSEATLTDQTRGKDWEYRVIAVNKTGEGIPSNMVAVVV